MNAFSFITGLAALVLAASFALRLHALKQSKVGAAGASRGQRVCMLLVAGAAFFHAQVAFMLQRSSWTEMLLTIAFAVYGVVMWWNVRSKVVVPMRVGLPIRS